MSGKSPFLRTNLAGRPRLRLSASRGTDARKQDLGLRVEENGGSDDEQKIALVAHYFARPPPGSGHRQAEERMRMERT